MKWIDPWWSTENQPPEFHEGFRKQLELEVSPGHPMYGLPVKLIGRSSANDDAVFQIMDGSDRVAVVHLTWSKNRQSLPWPITAIYDNLESFAKDCMIWGEGN